MFAEERLGRNINSAGIMWEMIEEVFQGIRVPDVLTTGNHPKIAQWKHEQALARTMRLRPDLLGDEEI
jgi:tRNA (guanine-N1)-methyltransferase